MWKSGKKCAWQIATSATGNFYSNGIWRIADKRNLGKNWLFRINTL